MGWLSFFFPADTNQRSRRGQALSTTDEAFSLRSSSPVFQTVPDSFGSEAPNTPDLETTVSVSYTYPPPGPGSYAYVPANNTHRRSKATSLLPLHHDPLHSPIPSSSIHPPLAQTWTRIRTWLNREIPELGDTLNYGIAPQDLAQIEVQFGFALPPAVRESYLIVDGQEPESAAGCPEGLFFGLTLLPLEDVYEEWRFWREVDDDAMTGANPRLQSAMQSFPPDWIRREYSQRGWIPLIADKAGNYLGVDLNPGERGSVGQVIVFGRDFDTKVVMWKGDGRDGWAKWLASFAEELESGETFDFLTGNDTSEGSEDGVGYDSYFSEGHGQGEGGDSFGGMRLIGEYRGWSTLEAWADRSLRKWYKVGAIPLEPPKADEPTSSPTIGALDFDAQKHVGHPPTQPVVDKSESTGTPSSPEIIQASKQTSPSLPVISISKAPTPLPVELPTADDIIPPVSQESSSSSFYDDPESGHSIGMREVSYQDVVSISSKRGPTPNHVPQVRTNNEHSPEAIPLPISPDVNNPVDLPRLTISPTTTGVQDLFGATGPPFDLTAIEPTSPPSIESLKQELISIEDPKLIAPEEHIAPDRETDVSIRLVGGGGVVGTADSAVYPHEEPPVDFDTSTSTGHETMSADTASTPNASAPPKDINKQEKRRSGLSGLKRLGNLGGLRKKDSRGSTQEMMN